MDRFLIPPKSMRLKSHVTTQDIEFLAWQFEGCRLVIPTIEMVKHGSVEDYFQAYCRQYPKPTVQGEKDLDSPVLRDRIAMRLAMYTEFQYNFYLVDHKNRFVHYDMRKLKQQHESNNSVVSFKPKENDHG